MSKALTYILVFFVLLSFSNLVWADPFIDNNNDTVTDKSTGLVWQKGDSFHDVKKGMNWYEALEYITSKNSEKFAGHDNWRLPTLNNLWQSS
jgi:hypothetical protein